MACAVLRDCIIERNICNKRCEFMCILGPRHFLSWPDPCRSTLSVLHVRPSVNALPLFCRDGENKSMCLYNMSKPRDRGGGWSSLMTSHWNITFFSLISSYVAFLPSQRPCFSGIAHSTENSVINHMVGESRHNKHLSG